MNTFGSIDLDAQSTSTSTSQSRKAPKLVYCGDGVLEEYSDDENDIGDEGKLASQTETIETVRIFTDFI